MCLCYSGLVITMVVSLLFILLLRYTADVLLWLIIFGVIAAIGYGEKASQTVLHLSRFFVYIYVDFPKHFCCHGKHSQN